MIKSYAIKAAVAGCILLTSCSKKPVTQPSFYFWRTTASLSVSEKSAIDQYHVKTLYTRFFDVDMPDEQGEPQPMGTIDSLELLSKQLSVIPVVYITNRTFLRLKKEEDVVLLADRVLKKVNGLYPNYKELQIDCDWSEKSRAHYFLFLKTLKQQLPNGIKLTATIRLHQIKYAERTGVPPVDGGMLMFYNMGDLHNSASSNSIFDADIAEKYTARIKSYSLHLDAALPVFRWYVHYRNGKIMGLITKKQLPEVKDTSCFYANNSGVLFTVKQAQLMNDVYYKTGDLLKYEAVNDEALLNAANLLQHHLNEEDRTIVLYDLDDINIQYYEKNTLETVFSTFN